MKRKLLATLLALATAGCCALGLTACADEPETPPEKEPEETISGEVTEEQWKNELKNLKGLGEFKNYTIDISGEDDGVYQYTRFVDFEKPCVYDDDGTYWGIENIYSSGEHTVCDYYEIYENGLVKQKTANLDYDSAYNNIMCYSLLITLQNLKSDGKTIDLENAYEVFTYNEETKAYTAENIDIITDWGYDAKNEAIDYETKYIKWTYDYIYEKGDMEIAFNESCYTVKITFEEWNAVLTFKDFNTTAIELPEEIQNIIDSL